jgi:hypothetical protein
MKFFILIYSTHFPSLSPTQNVLSDVIFPKTVFERRHFTVSTTGSSAQYGLSLAETDVAVLPQPFSRII